MPIDLRSEQLLTLTEAAEAIPALDGRHPHVTTVWRWVRRGIRGVRLEHVRVGYRMCTSREALNRFVNRLADAEDQSTTDGSLQSLQELKFEEQEAVVVVDEMS